LACELCRLAHARFIIPNRLITTTTTTTTHTNCISTLPTFRVKGGWAASVCNCGAFSVWTPFKVPTVKKMDTREDCHWAHACSLQVRYGNQRHPRVQLPVEKRALYSCSRRRAEQCCSATPSVQWQNQSLRRSHAWSMHTLMGRVCVLGVVGA
jgi:hypothetical protein